MINELFKKYSYNFRELEMSQEYLETMLIEFAQEFQEILESLNN